MAEKSIKINFKTSTFRKIPNPYVTSKNPTEKKPEMSFMICDVKEIPGNIPMGTNPRKQNEKTKVAKKIQNSLLNHTERNFYLLNRGLLLSAKDVNYDPKDGVVTVTFEDLKVHGDVDGGHTYKIIQDNADSLDYGEQYVKIEILTGIEDIFEQLAAARNTSVQVKDQSIAELENRFDVIKNALSKEKYCKDISYKENDLKRIDVTDILAILNLFNIDRYPNDVGNAMPIISYSSKKSCVDQYITESKKHQTDESMNPYYKMTKIMPDIIKLYEEIETGMPSFYKGDSVGVKKYGAITGVVTVKTGKKKFKSKFFETEMEYSTPTAFIFPILGSFRALVYEKNNMYEWILNPFDILSEVGHSLVDSTIQMSRDLGNNPNATGKNNNLWQTLFLQVKIKTMSN